MAEGKKRSVHLDVLRGLAGLAVPMLPAFGFSYIAPLNPCSWTLYYQNLGNILYALVVRHMSRRMLAAAAALSAVAMAVFVFLPFLLLVGIGSDAPGGRFAQVADFFGRLSFPVYMSHFMFLPIHRHCVVQCSAKVSFATNCWVFAGAYVVILLIGCGAMKFWERVQAK